MNWVILQLDRYPAQHRINSRSAPICIIIVKQGSIIRLHFFFCETMMQDMSPYRDYFAGNLAHDVLARTLADKMY